MNNRHQRIREQLTWLENTGVLDGWEGSSPQGKRWEIWKNGGVHLTLPTSEVEIWISGALTTHSRYAKEIWACDRIRDALSGQAWTASTLDQVADFIRLTNREIEEVK